MKNARSLAAISFYHLGFYLENVGVTCEPLTLINSRFFNEIILLPTRIVNFYLFMISKIEPFLYFWMKQKWPILR